MGFLSGSSGKKRRNGHGSGYYKPHGGMGGLGGMLGGFMGSSGAGKRRYGSGSSGKRRAGFGFGSSGARHAGFGFGSSVGSSKRRHGYGAPFPPQQARPQAGRKASGKSGVCPNCHAPVPAGAKFCLECGTKLGGGAFCPQCGAALPPTGKFCPECGTPRG